MNSFEKSIALTLFFIIWFAISLSVKAQSKLPEEVVFVPKKLFLGSVSLETTIFKPIGDGPFPLVIINHGKANGLTQFQPRYRPLSAVRFSWNVIMWCWYLCVKVSLNRVAITWAVAAVWRLMDLIKQKIFHQ